MVKFILHVQDDSLLAPGDSILSVFVKVVDECLTRLREGCPGQDSRFRKLPLKYQPLS